jgi:basic amino acid/polyamine antiporter, APA family
MQVDKPPGYFCREPDVALGGAVRTGERPSRAGGWHAASFVAGSMLGIGIFIGPPQVAAHVSSTGWYLLVWVAGAVVALCGAISVAELGSTIPRSGGEYVYLREAYGKPIAFAAGILQILAIFPGSLAALSVAAASFQLPALLGPAAAEPIRFLGVELSAAPLWASLIVVAFTAINHLGIVVSGRVEVLLAGAPVVLLAVVSSVVLAGRGLPQAAAALGAFDPGALAAAFLPVYFAYSGWNAAIYVAGEIDHPERNLPRALIGGTVGVAAVYLVLCTSFATLFPLPRLALVGEAGTAAARELYGSAGEGVATLLILCAVLASINGTVLGGSRIVQAMAENGEGLAFAARRDPRTGAPVAALWLQAAWAILLVAWRRFDELLAYTSSAMLITAALSVVAVIVLRWRRPELDRPYRVPLYPLPPILFAAASLSVVAILALHGDSSVWLSLGWFGLALAAYRLLRDRLLPSGRGRREAAGEGGNAMNGSR